MPMITKIKARPVVHLKQRRLARGMSIIELLIGVAIGLFILAGASAMFVSNVTNSRQLLLESRFNQEMRSTMDLISRDLRRSAYWANSLKGTTAVGSSSLTQRNEYASVTLTDSNQIGYAYSRDATENDALDGATEQFGIKLDTGTQAIQFFIGDTWRTVTDTNILRIPNTGLVITPTVTAIDIRAACSKPCTDSSSAPTCPKILVRSYNIVLTGNSAANAAVSRTLRTQVRVRNDAVTGSCPA